MTVLLLLNVIVCGAWSIWMMFSGECIVFLIVVLSIRMLLEFWLIMKVSVQIGWWLMLIGCVMRVVRGSWVSVFFIG